MGKKFMRKTSKRTTTRQVQKQQKKLREHNAKVRRDKKKNPKKYTKSKKVSSFKKAEHQTLYKHKTAVLDRKYYFYTCNLGSWCSKFMPFQRGCVERSRSWKA